MNIIDIICEPVRTGFYRDDQAAIRAGATHDGFLYDGTPLTSGFSAIREPGFAISVMLILSDGQVALGDCTEVQYAGVGGRASVFGVEESLGELRDHVIPTLLGRSVDTFRDLAQEVDGLEVNGRPLATAVRYGVSQALLHATSLVRGLTMAEIIQDEYDTGIDIAPVALFAQSGDDRYLNVDKMIVKEVGSLPHALINEVATKLGVDGSILLEYVAWLRDRVLALRTSESYSPHLHLDTYGTIGNAFGGDLELVAQYIGELAKAAAPFRLRLEHPIDAGSRDAQIATYVELRQRLAELDIPVELVVDEWCNTLDDIKKFVDAGAADVIHVKTPDLGGIGNTVEALLLVRQGGYLAYCGGTCNETEVSARVCTQVAMACGADEVLAKPGMGVDEGVMIVGNEMARTMSLIRHRATTDELLRPLLQIRQ